jgi:hypothetical protein
VSNGIAYYIQFKVNGKNNRDNESTLIMMARSAIKGGPR